MLLRLAYRMLTETSPRPALEVLLELWLERDAGGKRVEKRQKRGEHFRRSW